MLGLALPPMPKHYPPNLNEMVEKHIQELKYLQSVINIIQEYEAPEAAAEALRVWPYRYYGLLDNIRKEAADYIEGECKYKVDTYKEHRDMEEDGTQWAEQFIKNKPPIE